MGPLHMRERGREKERELSPYLEKEKRKTEKRKNKIREILKMGISDDLIVLGGLFTVQFFYAGNSIFLNYVMKLGVSPLTIIIFSSLATFLILSLPSVYFERSKWPKKFSGRLLIKLVVISVGGVTLFQIVFMKGLELTSPAMATAMPNLAPALIFVIAATTRVEKIDLSCVYSKLKISGTLLCVMGALALSIIQSASNPQTPEKVELLLNHPHTHFDTQKFIGCIYLLGSVLLLSSNVVLQAATLAEFPAPISMCAITSLIGMISTTIWELIQYQNFDYGWPYVTIRELAGYSLFGGMVSGVCVSFNGWAMKKRGPVLVSMFNPIATVISVILSYLTMGDLISIGSIAGMFLMFSGLYFFLWAKGKEEQYYLGKNVDQGTTKLKDDVENPLLS